MPAIEHVVVLMLENHSYDNFFGMLGRGPGQTPRGDGFTLAADGRPTATNPYPNGRRLRAFPMPTTCQLDGKPSQEWEQSHIQYANGQLNGFVVSDSGPVAMGYWTGGDLPFTYDLSTRFPIGDRWFSSALAQTDPNRRFLIAATAMGMTDDIGGSPGNIVPDASLAAPPNGTIFERLSQAGISWVDYCQSFPTGATMELYPTVDGGFSETNVKSIDQFFTDAAAGNLPSFSLLDPDYGTQSQEDPSTSSRARRSWPRSCAPSAARRPGDRRCSSSPTTSMAATTTMSPRRRRSPRTPWRLRFSLGSRRTTATPATAFASPPWWSAPTRSPVTRATSSTTTPRFWPSSSTSGTCRP